MPRKKAKLCPAEETSGDASAGAGDCLSALPDVLLHHVMSFLRAREVARTCVLAPLAPPLGLRASLEHLKLSGTLLRDKTLRQLSSQRPSLEVVELKNCYLNGREISSASLKSLTMVECRIMADLSVTAPDLVSLCCVTPYHQAPLFKNLGSLATGTIMLDDSFSRSDYELETHACHWRAKLKTGDYDQDNEIVGDRPYATYQKLQ